MKNRILRPAVMLAAGPLLGVASRLLDLYTQNPGNIFSQMAVWILLGTLISIYSPTPAPGNWPTSCPFVWECLSPIMPRRC